MQFFWFILCFPIDLCCQGLFLVNLQAYRLLQTSEVLLAMVSHDWFQKKLVRCFSGSLVALEDL